GERGRGGEFPIPNYQLPNSQLSTVNCQLSTIYRLPLGNCSMPAQP
ncbi:MAG: hypothetical protein HC786_33545, partial [Richelia sp. CSU_2_1]|nr:hypothetical protein [Richelia sp. CSU_2_1]